MRYEREVRFRFIGPQERCREYTAIARKFLGELYNQNIVIGDIDYTTRTIRLSNGVRITAYWNSWMPLLEIDVQAENPKPEEGVQYLIRAAWEPEGIILTPSTDAERDGWGLPSRKSDATGESLNVEINEVTGEPVNAIGLTPGGSQPQVLLNRYPNNKYLDKAEYIVGLPESLEGLATDNVSLRPSYDSSVPSGIIYQYWHKVSKPWSFATPDQGGDYGGQYYDGPVYWQDNEDTLIPGVYRVSITGGQPVGATLLIEQFNADWSSNIYEVKAEDIVNDVGEVIPQWYCHRPEEILYGSDTSETLFQETNSYRLAVGQDELFRMVRGDGNSAFLAAFTVAASSDVAEYFGHSNENFIVGYRTTGGRVLNSTGREPFLAYADNVRENLIAWDELPDDIETGEDLGLFMAEQWKNSPGHYANMVDPNWTESVWDFYTWGYGTKGASHQIGGVGGGGTFNFRSNPLDSSVTIPLVPPLENAAVWSQIFTNRATWLPIYDRLHEGVHGASGTFNGTNGWACSNYVASRRAGWGRYVYELPADLAPLVTLDPEDDFLALVGSAVIEIDGEKWIRCVYWKSDSVTDAAYYNGEYPAEGDYLRLYVVRFPVRLMEASVLPWRPNIPGTYEIEYEKEYLLADGWITNPPGHVTFNSDGSKFVFTLYKISDTYTQALDYIASDWTNERSNLSNPRAALNPVHIEWDQTILSTFAEPTQYTPTPLVATVTTYLGDVDLDGVETNWESIAHYERQLSGSIEVFPHYDASDTLTYLTLVVDEYQKQRTKRADLNWADRCSYCWRYRKLVFPSGKEIPYMQQYMKEELTTEPVIDNDFATAPGTKTENFYCVIHYLDELREDIIYSQIHTNKFHWTFNSEPYYRTNGDVHYKIDLNPKAAPGEIDEQVQETLYTIFQDDTIAGGQPALNAPNISAEDFYWSLPDTRWLYQMDVSPCTFFLSVPPSLGAPPGYTYADTVGIITPDVELVMAFGFGGENGEYDRPAYRSFPETQLDAPWCRPPFDDYTVACYTGGTYYGDSNIWYFGTGKLPRSFMTCNIAPPFSKLGECDSKVIRYDDRIIVRIGVKHVHKVGYLPPAYLKPAGSVFGFGEWSYYAPPTDGEVLLWSNFDIDEAVGISDVRDVWPMGKII